MPVRRTTSASSVSARGSRRMVFTAMQSPNEQCHTNVIHFPVGAEQILRACGAQDDTSARSCGREKSHPSPEKTEFEGAARPSGVPAPALAADARDQQPAGTLPT